MTERIVTTWIAVVLAISSARRRAQDRFIGEVGEGVISTAIAVLIIALLGAAMWVTFDRLWAGAEVRIEDSVNQIGG